VGVVGYSIASILYTGARAAEAQRTLDMVVAHPAEITAATG